MTRNLRFLQGAQFVSLLGDGLYLAVILNYALQATGGDARASSGVVVAENLPYLLLGLWAGVLVDRWDRRRLMMGADLLRAGVLLALYLADRAGWITGAWPIGVAAALLTLGALFFNPARDALIPELAEGEDLVKANAGVAVSQHLAHLLGPLLAALLLAARPIAEVFLWDAVSFLGSFVLVAAIRTRKPASSGPRPDLNVKDALRYVASRSDLKALLFLTMLNNLWIMGPAMVGSAFLVNRMVGLKQGPVFYGVYLAVFSVGMVAGSLIVTRMARIPRWKLLVAGIALDGISFLPFEWIAREGSFPLLLAALFVHATVVPLIVVVRPAVLQAHVPAERLGQVFALVNLAVFGFTALSAAGAGWLMGLGVDPGRLFTYAGIGGALSGVLALLLRPLRSLV